VHDKTTIYDLVCYPKISFSFFFLFRVCHIYKSSNRWC